MAIKIDYRNGTSEIIKDAASDDYVHNKDHNLFIIQLGRGKIMIPDCAVQKIGAGRVEEICTVENGRKTKTEEVFIYE